MKVVFMGGRPLGAACLKELIKRNERILLIVPNWDDDGNDSWYESPIKIAKHNNLDIYKTKKLSADSKGIKFIKSLKPDVIFSIFFIQVLTKEILAIPRLGCINIHFAPLPRYRGYYPGSFAIMNGEKNHGVTMHFMNERIDAGDIIIQKPVTIEDYDTGYDLYQKCVKVGHEIFIEGLEYIHSGNIPRISQDDSQATYYKKLIPNNGEVNWNWDGKRIYNFIRAWTFPPFPPPFFSLGDKRMIIVEDSRDTS